MAARGLTLAELFRMAHGRMRWKREFALMQAGLVWGFKGNQWQAQQFIKTGGIPDKPCELPPETEERVAKVQRWMKQHRRMPSEAETEAILNG